MRHIIIGSMLLALSGQAQASVVDYCAAYARDIADMSQNQKDWQRRHDNAENNCITRFSAFVPEPAKARPKATAAKKAQPVPPPPPKKLKEATGTVEAAKAIPQLEPGSVEWNNYCKQKYVSFNETTGTYTSKTGVERKCLVTAE